MALDLTANRRGQAALGEVIAIWVKHLLSVAVDIEPFVEVKNTNFTWYVGLDAEGTRIGDRLWDGEAIEDSERERIAALYTLRFRNAGIARGEIGDEPIYLILAMNSGQVLRMKPQNLIMGLPLRHLETAS
jgi:hypothetical protein